MLIFWRIRYLDSRDKQFKDRDLWLETDELDPADRAAVELCYQLRDSGRGRDILRYRNLFREETHSGANLNELINRHGGMGSVFLHDYSEDETGEELTDKQMAVILSGRSDSVMFSAGTPQYVIDYVFADKTPIEVDQISLSKDDLQTLGYFTRDAREMQAAAFFHEKPGRLMTVGGNDPVLQTASTDDEIRSFVTIFRRLYMIREPANFLKASAVFEKALGTHCLAKWIKGAAEEYEAELSKPPHFVPMTGQTHSPFTCKRLIDVFVYTQYAHQPDEKRTGQFNKCLQAVGGKRDTLTWLFLTELWKCSLHISNAGNIIANFYERYCEHHKVVSSILDSVSKESAGIGTLEKREARRERILREKAEELARAMWERDGFPEGGCARYVGKARADLTSMMVGPDAQAEASCRQNDNGDDE